MRFKLFLVISLCHWVSFGQTDNTVINEYLERYIENTIDEVDIQQFASELLFYYENPLDLNKANATALFAVPFLTGFQSLEIIEHRKKFGSFISLYELQVLPSFDLTAIHGLLPFINIKSNEVSLSNAKKIWEEGKHQFISLAETNRPKNRGFTSRDTITVSGTNHYLGSPIYTNLRYRFDYKRYISYGVNMEKDAGEQFLNGSNPWGYDYVSFYFSARDIGKLKALNLGDFQANFGQGLTLSTGLAFGKSSIITNSKRNFNGFGAYRSLRENAYLRGGAVALKLDKIDVGIFASYKNVDGNAVSGLNRTEEANNEPEFVTNIQEDGGFHRTANEIEDKDAIGDFQTGIYAEYTGNHGRIGTINYLRKLSTTLQPSQQPYNKFNFRGNRYVKNGLYYDYVYRNMNLYGEVSHSSHESSIAHLHGALLSLNRALDLSFVYRKYDREFITLQTNGFGENSNTSNEQGFYTGFEAKINPHVTILGYYDLFHFPWLRFQSAAPTVGNDFWIEAQYKPNKQFTAYYRYRIETKQSTLAGGNIKQLANETLGRHRVHINYVVTKGVSLRSRIEWNRYQEGNSQSAGSLVYQDIIFKPFGRSLQLSGRIAYGRIEQFQNRIYSFEQTPLYDYPLFTHGFTGLRFYALARYKVAQNVDLWFRYAHTQHDVPLTMLTQDYAIGSGLEKITGNKRQTFTLQIRYIIK